MVAADGAHRNRESESDQRLRALKGNGTKGFDKFNLVVAS